MAVGANIETNTGIRDSLHTLKKQESMPTSYSSNVAMRM